MIDGDWSTDALIYCVFLWVLVSLGKISDGTAEWHFRSILLVALYLVMVHREEIVTVVQRGDEGTKLWTGVSRPSGKTLHNPEM